MVWEFLTCIELCKNPKLYGNENTWIMCRYIDLHYNYYNEDDSKIMELQLMAPKSIHWIFLWFWGIDFATMLTLNFDSLIRPIFFFLKLKTTKNWYIMIVTIGQLLLYIGLIDLQGMTIDHSNHYNFLRWNRYQARMI